MPHRRPESSSSTDELAEILRELRDEVRVLRQVVDELREECQWANRNSEPLPLPPRFHLTSMPLDPTSDDWEINRLKPEDLPDSDCLPETRHQNRHF
jgi:hypothetical protein